MRHAGSDEDEIQTKTKAGVMKSRHEALSKHWVRMDELDLGG